MSLPQLAGKGYKNSNTSTQSGPVLRAGAARQLERDAEQPLDGAVLYDPA